MPHTRKIPHYYSSKIYFILNCNKYPVIVIKEGIEVEHTDSKSIAVKSANVLLDECKSTANRALKDNKNQDPQQILDQLDELQVLAGWNPDDRPLYVDGYRQLIEDDASRNDIITPVAPPQNGNGLDQHLTGWEHFPIASSH